MGRLLLKAIDNNIENPCWFQTIRKSFICIQKKLAQINRKKDSRFLINRKTPVPESLFS